MTDRHLFAALAAAGVLVAAVAGWIAWRAWDGESDASPAEAIAGTATLRPQQHLFGDPVHARVEIVVDHERVDPDTVRIRPNFGAYRDLRPVHRTRIEGGATTRLRYDYLLACLTKACIPNGAGHVDFGQVNVSYRTRTANGTETTTLDWPPLRAAARIAPQRMWEAGLRADIGDLPPPTYRVSPRAVELVALLLAVLFASAALILTLRRLPLDELAVRLGVRKVDRRTRLERALALVWESADAGRAEEGRRALERLARELRLARNPELARDASRLAWSRRFPIDDGLGSLSTQVEQLISNGSRR